jgi:hypothetical protein
MLQLTVGADLATRGASQSERAGGAPWLLLHAADAAAGRCLAEA